MLRNLLLLVAVAPGFSAPPAPYDRLVDAVKLWTYVKYCHPYVTATNVDWDAALVNATPKILAARDEHDFRAAVDGMLAALHDPLTHVLAGGATAQSNAIAGKADISVADGITVVHLGPGTVTRTDALRISAILPRQLAGRGTVLFDIRGTTGTSYALTESLPVAADSIGPSLMMRAHLGYANDRNSEGGRFRSYWETQDGVRVTGTANGIRAVFLINHETEIPQVALAMQQSGDGAIISEDAVDESQIGVSRVFTASSELSATVRTGILSYGDGTTGLAANVIVHGTGAAALRTALDIAKHGSWPPSTRPALKVPPARFSERDYADQRYPTTEYRMLAAARVWGVFRYFHPYRDLYGEDWDSVLLSFLPRMASAADAREYGLLVTEMAAHTHDSHGSVTGGVLPNWYATPAPPVEVRWIEDMPVVTRVFDSNIDVRPGDIVTRIDGEPFQKRSEELTKYISASTPQRMFDDMTSLWLLRGPAGSTVRLTLRRPDQTEREVSLTRVAGVRFSPYRPGEAFRLLKPKIGYVDMQKLPIQQVDAMFEMFHETDWIIMDMRGYPQGALFAVAARLAEEAGALAARWQLDLVTPDRRETGDVSVVAVNLEQRIPATDKPRYKGRTVMLIDERAISQAEHSGLFYRTANGTKFIGTPTAGADGTDTFFTAPGGLRIDFTGADVRWPDGKQLQRVGLIPDIEVRPTIAGVREGRDEILDRAIVYIETGR